jgi:hypothetical protein
LQVLVGKIASDIGYQWSFYLISILLTGLFPLLLLFCPETTYRREQKFDIDTMGNLVEQMPPSMVKEEMTVELSAGSPGELDRAGNGAKIAGVREHPHSRTKVSWKRSLLPFNGRHTDERFLHLLLRPFPLFFHPGILWACLIQGALIGWTVMIGVVLAAIMLGPPLWFGEEKTGYMYTGAFVGALIGFIICGLLSDWSARFLTRLNHGVYEPEFRLFLVIPQLVLGSAGLYGFGFTGGDPYKYGWLWPDFFFALEVAGMVRKHIPGYKF